MRCPGICGQHQPGQRLAGWQRVTRDVKRSPEALCHTAGFPQREGAQAVAARVRSDAKVAHGKLRDELVPAENVAIRLGLFRDMLKATEEHLGERAAAELAEGLHVLDSIASVRVLRYTQYSAKDIRAPSIVATSSPSSQPSSLSEVELSVRPSRHATVCRTTRWVATAEASLWLRINASIRSTSSPTASSGSRGSSAAASRACTTTSS